MDITKPSLQKVVRVTYEMVVNMRSSHNKASAAGTILVFYIDGHFKEVVTYSKRRSHMVVQLY